MHGHDLDRLLICSGMMGGNLKLYGNRSVGMMTNPIQF